MLPIRALTSLAIVAAAVTAAPTAQNGTGFVWNPAPSDQTTCDPSSFSQAPNGEAADWRQCAALSSSWASENGTFRIVDISGDGFVPILKSKGCVLGIKPTEQGHGPYTVGDADIKTIFKDALKGFSEGTELAVEGNIKCNAAAGGRADLHWQIYDPSSY